MNSPVFMPFSELNNRLTNESSETFNFGIKDGVRGFYTNPSRADDSFIPFKSEDAKTQLLMKTSSVVVSNQHYVGRYVTVDYNIIDTNNGNVELLSDKQQIKINKTGYYYVSVRPSWMPAYTSTIAMYKNGSIIAGRDSVTTSYSDNVKSITQRFYFNKGDIISLGVSAMGWNSDPSGYYEMLIIISTDI